MTRATEIDMQAFEPPGKGEWTSLRDHFPTAVTPEYAALLPATMAEGEAIPFAAYGMPVRTLTVGLVHGHVYVTPAPLVGRPSNSLPPRPFLWLAARVVPAFRRRTVAAATALRTRPWLEEADRWYASERAEWVEANLRLQSEDPCGLSRVALADHLTRTRAHAASGYRRHFALHGPDLIPTGLLLARAEDWGIPAEDVLPVLMGSSPASLGSGPTLDALRAAMTDARAEPVTIEEVRAVAPAELDAFLEEHGWRLTTGYDLDGRTLIELPDLVVTLTKAARPGPTPPGQEVVDALRARVPASDRAELERLVADARATFGMRDDNGGLTAAWPMGLLRRAMLAAGDVLARGGVLRQASHALEVTVDELTDLLHGRLEPSASEVDERAGRRLERSALVPPLKLGPTLHIRIGALPAPMRLMSRAQLALRDAFTAPSGGRAELHGDGIGDRVYRGRACVATDPAEALARLEPGDVLVTLGTTPAFNMALSIAGAVVVEEGGLLSHAAVIARELGLPALIGAAGATTGIRDGSIVEVDPVAGCVRASTAWPHGG